MAGRGRGRGRTALSFNVEELGFGRGEALPTSVLQPPPLFPPLSAKPAALCTGEKYDYLAALAQEFRNTAVESPFYMKIDNRRRDVKRYSDKYQQSNNGDCDIQFKPDYSRLPSELQPAKAKVKTKPKTDVKRTTDITQSLKTLEERETNEEGEKGEEEKEEEDDEQEEEVVYDEEEEEEETDYLVSYFDNGEGFNDEEDDTLDEPTY